MKRIQALAIVFDFDGTLVDASDAICRSFNQALQSRGYSSRPHHEIRSMIGRPLVEMFATALGKEGEDGVEELLEEYRKVFLPHSLTLARLLPGAAEVLAHYGPRLQLGIATSRKSDGAVFILERFDLLAFFSAIVGIEHVQQSKPHPEAIERVLGQLRVSPQRAVMVGDTVHDMTAGKRACLTTVGVTTGPDSREALKEAGADHVISSLSHLLEIIPGD